MAYFAYSPDLFGSRLVILQYDVADIFVMKRSFLHLLFDDPVIGPILKKNFDKVDYALEMAMDAMGVIRQAISQHNGN
jgi:hypothetical protein